MKAQDVVVLMKLQALPRPVRIRELAEGLGYDTAGTHRSFKRLTEVGLFVPGRGVPIRAAEEFLVAAARYFFVATRGAQTRGVATSWAVVTPNPHDGDDEEFPLVWPTPDGPTWGVALTPLHSIVLPAATADPQLHRRLAMIDVLRDQPTGRSRSMATKMLRDELRS